MSNKPINDPQSRRQFLKSTGMVVGALGGMALSRPAQAVPIPAPIPQQWDTTVDVLIVGTGFAGLAAAIEARNAQAEVLVIDKMPLLGGNSVLNGGDLAAAGSKMQQEIGIEDSPELMYQDMLKAGSGLNYPELARTVAEHSVEALEWAQSIGAQFNVVNYHGGHSVKRAHQLVQRSGSGLIIKQQQKAREQGAVIEQRAKLLRLIVEPDGRVIGAEVRRRYKFPDENSGEIAYIRARKGVVLASGGFSQGVAMRQMYDPRLTDAFTSTNHPGATGEAIMAACMIGALDTQMDWIQLGPWTSPDENGFGYVPQFVERVVGYGLMVDPATGKRFFKETGNRKERADAIIQLGHPAIIIADKTNTLNMVDPGQREGALKNGSLKPYDSLEALAKAYDMPVDAFVAQVNRWNEFVSRRNDADLGCMIFKDAVPNVTPPFYAARLWPRVHHTMGGLAINKDAQVIGFDLKPIPGLYAAGETVGGVHGAVRLGSVAMTDCIVFGRIAGKNAAASA
ncbi:flavocytochrome c [Brenneria izbisi]|uniref:Flavocytochrome c n=1 Tax=Brenneria izbisi TaxID=2939450 RepID=A0AA42C2U0_9GAMM|nr:flavocytochrome c [Brenneria izbisi]MCV9879833.1 flavocytochrome c [Brenneria izbisi]MCV9883222.1 flavocytochrome c [Brenneria izbisi]